MAADKYIGLVSGKLTNTSAVQAGGGANAGKIVALNDTTGLLDVSMIPGGASPLPWTVAATAAVGDIAAGDLVYITSAGVATKAIATSAGALAQGFALTGATAGNAITVQLSGVNTAVVQTLTVGTEYYLSGASAGVLVSTPPSTPGQYVQPVGFAIGANALMFNRQLAVVV